MPAAQIAFIEANHNGRSHRVNVEIYGSLGRQPRDLLADAAGSIAHSAGVDSAADGQRLGKQIIRRTSFCIGSPFPKRRS